jgi:hypothetical protein
MSHNLHPEAMNKMVGDDITRYCKYSPETEKLNNQPSKGNNDHHSLQLNRVKETRIVIHG